MPSIFPPPGIASPLWAMICVPWVGLVIVQPNTAMSKSRFIPITLTTHENTEKAGSRTNGFANLRTTLYEPMLMVFPRENCCFFGFGSRIHKPGVAGSSQAASTFTTERVVLGQPPPAIVGPGLSLGAASTQSCLS